MSLLQMSVSAAVMILAVLIIRALAINRLPKRVFPALWSLVLLRLLLPFSLPSPLSIYSLVGQTPVGARIAQSPAAELLPILPNPVPPGSFAAPAPESAPLPLEMIVWGIGAALCALYYSIIYFRCVRNFRDAQPLENGFAAAWLSEHKLKRTIRLRQSGRITAPLTYGIFRPVILMPNGMDWTDTRKLQYILAHEYLHIRRFDALSKLLLTAGLCVHWFNPLVWVMVLLANRDWELSCDEAVVRSFGETTKTAYALALISMKETQSGMPPLYSSFSKNAIEERITAIMKMKKTSRIMTVAAVLLVACVATGFSTSAMGKDAAGLSDPPPAASFSPSSNSSSGSDSEQNDTTSAPPAGALSVAIAQLDEATPEVAVGTYSLKKGDCWGVSFTWTGPGQIYVACQPSSLGTAFKSGQLSTSPDSSGWKTAPDKFEISKDGEYTFFIGLTRQDNGDAPTARDISGAIQVTAPAGAFTLTAPVHAPDAVVTASYGWRKLNGSIVFNNGVDIALANGKDAAGTPVYAAAAGEVTFAGFDGTHGRIVRIKHTGADCETWYAHCSELAVIAGDSVTQGQEIAKIGSTGRSTGPHLHFEVHKDGTKNPLDYFSIPTVENGTV